MKIVLSAVMAFFFLACSQNEKKTSNESNATLTANKAEKTSQVSPVEKKVEEVKEEIAEKSQETTEDLAAKTKDVVDDVKAEVQEKKTEVKNVIKETEAKVAKEVATLNGATIYKACASCHGQNGEKQALNKSQVIQGWESSKVAAALKGYKDGTYGGAMKAMMKGQVAKLGDAEIQAVSDYISGL